MAADVEQLDARLERSRARSFRFVSRELDANGLVTLRYALDEQLEFVERIELPLSRALDERDRGRVEGLLSLLHWVAGVSYFKVAAPPLVSCESGAPGPAAAALLEALYSEGLGEFAYTNALAALPRPVFAVAHGGDAPRSAADGIDVDADASRIAAPAPTRVLVPVGGGKDSAVAIEIVRRAGVEEALFSIGDAAAIARTAQVAGLEHLIARRQLDPSLGALNRAGALNGHVPITAIVSCVALLSAALNGFDTVAMANERSASRGNLSWDGIEVNHQFSKGLRAERLLSAAAAEADGGVGIFSLLRPASELAIARAFARMADYHSAFTSCNAIFRIDPALRAASWCCDCPKCRFVYLALAPFMAPERLAAIFGADLLADERQFEGFALLTATGGHKPFECVGEEQESIAAIRLLADDPRWSGHSVVRRLVEQVLAGAQPSEGDPAEVLALSSEHEVPDALMGDVRAVLGA
jgi:hypothetical protein